MKKFFLTLTAALLGICLAVSVHCSFMLVEAESGSMLPSIAPGQKALIYLLADTDDVVEGDIVAYRQPYYVVDGDNGVLMRRVERVLQDLSLIHISPQLWYNEPSDYGRGVATGNGASD